MLHADEANIRPFRVIPSLPEPLNPLLEIARNLWWTWNPDAVGLFVRLDPEGWNRHGHNPVKLLGHVTQERLEQAARDEMLLHEINRVHAQMERHCQSQGWFSKAHPEARDARIAYFSAEFGLTECFQIYSGGLGVLAGDHLKSASELGIPLVAVGLLYQHGYFMQYLSPDGWQQETYPDLDFANQPVMRVRHEDGQWRKIKVPLADREVTAGIWVCQVGRIPLYLLDTNLPENRPEDRQITRNLYGGDVEMRIQQEIILGIGGMIALTEMGIEPTVCHINEGHAAFLALERVRQFIEREGVDFEVALAQQSAGHIFTTHTPVPAGIDRFHPHLMQHYFHDYVRGLRLDMDGLLALGRENVHDRNEYFSMAVLALRSSAYCNGVSRLHGEVARRMWRHIWPMLPEEEVPIAHVTNGVHSRSWLSRDMAQLFDRYLGYRWQHDPADFSVWERVESVPDEELWDVHTQRRRKLITWVRGRIRDQYVSHGRSREETERATGALDPDALTVGFARRFATYKRATLLLRNPERLLRLLNDEDRPIQFLIAGKAHPADSAGKEFIRELVRFSRLGAAHFDGRGEAAHFDGRGEAAPARASAGPHPTFLEALREGLSTLTQRGSAGLADPLDVLRRALDSFADGRGMRSHADRLIFLENYDINVARYLVTGCDMWLNTPRRGLEASGTSGMKAAVNGGVHCSILDGWWDEGYDPEAGFAIGQREQYASEHQADEIESNALFDLLEGHIIPEFYDRDATGLPRRWIERMKRSIAVLAPTFNTNRMVKEYADSFYIPAHQRSQFLAVDGSAEAKAVARLLQRYEAHWGEIIVESVHAETNRPIPVRTPLPVEAVVRLGTLQPSEVSVQIYTGQVAASGDLTDGVPLPMEHVEALDAGRHRYRGEVIVERSGRRGIAVRVIPNDPRLVTPFLPRLITWDRPPQRLAETVEPIEPSAAQPVAAAR